jgi:regulator of sirC expression with transglutaminase-like and TPR domain
MLDMWTERVSPSCENGSPVERAVCLSGFLFQEIGLRGNEEDYYDPRNSYLNAVLDRRTGLPIALSALYIEMARRIDLPAVGVGLPGHFIVAVEGPEESCLIDPFHGGMLLTRDDAAALVRNVTGYGGPLDPAWLKPVGSREILARMLLNLRGAYIRREAWAEAAATVERLRLLQPGEPEHLRDLGMLCQRAGSLRKAVGHFEDYLLLVGDTDATAPVRQNLNALVRQIARLN